MILLGTAGTSALGAGTDRPMLRTATEVREALKAYGKGVLHYFTLRGLVTSSSDTFSFILRDETGFISLGVRNGRRPNAGEVVEVFGDTRCEGPWSPATVRSFKILGTGRIPPPVPASLEDILADRFTFQKVIAEGTVEDAEADEFAPDWELILLKSGPFLTMVKSRNRQPRTPPASLIGAQICVTGTVFRSDGGIRLFSGCTIFTPGEIGVKAPPPDDPFDVEPLPELKRLDPQQISTMGRCRVEGTVEAVWNGGRTILMSRGYYLGIRIDLQEPTDIRPGARIVAAGLPAADVFFVNLRNAKAKAVGKGNLDLRPVDNGFGADYHNFGRLVRIEGVVRNRTEDDGLDLDCGNRIVTLLGGSVAGALDGIAVGSRIAATGICYFESGEWRPNMTYPQARNYTVILRADNAVEVLSRPPWWTAGRLLVLVVVLLAVLVAFLIWNRILTRYVERRSRQLLRETAEKDSARLKTEERTRLATELHDTIAQELTGIAMQVDAAELAVAKAPASVAERLRTIRLKLKNCRGNLRECMWDLRNRPFEEQNLGEAIRRTATPHAGDAALDIRCDIATSRLSDSAVHAVLCIVRELVLNAVRHGRASAVSIVGELRGGELDLAVTDNGCGFDPDRRPGPDEGHFGLQGIRERTHRLGGTVAIASVPGQGTTVTLKGLKPCAES